MWSKKSNKEKLHASIILIPISLLIGIWLNAVWGGFLVFISIIQAYYYWTKTQSED